MGSPGKQACSDEEFMSLFKQTGSPKEVANILGVTERAVYFRRKNLEKNYTEHLPAKAGSKNHRGDATDNPNAYLQRIAINGLTGTVVVSSDHHYWPGQKPSVAHKALLEVIREVKPKLNILNGDVFDGARLSRFPRNGWEYQPQIGRAHV